MDGNTIDEPIAEEVKVDPVTAATPGVSLASSSFLFKTPLDIRQFFSLILTFFVSLFVGHYSVS